VSDLIDSIKQGAEQVLSNIDQEGHIKSAIQGIRNQWTEVDRRRRINQLNSQVKTLQTEMKQLTEALGLQTLSLFDAGKISNPELARLCERIGELRTEIQERRSELNNLKAQAVTASSQCPKCQAEVPATAEFCPKCGTRVRMAQTEPASGAPPAAQQRVRLRCPKCKTILPPDAGFCPTCGAKLKMPQNAPTSKQFCASCGAEMGASARFCPVCGQAAKGNP
jgi:RNA polymerase subunit RPABC4/transcription elongation factor Spt4